MAYSDFGQLLGLGVVIVVAVGAVLLLLRLSERSARPAARVLGYPPDLFPAQELIGSGPLTALASIQARLAALEQRLPPHSDLRIWLWTFLNELRQIMDTAYRVTLIADIYEQPPALERLAAEVRQIEVEIAEHVTRRLLAQDADTQNELLEGRLATLRLCMRELANLAPVASSQ